MVKSSKLKSVYDKSTVEDQRKIYKNWAETYDAETLGDFGWMGFKPAAEEFAKRILDKDARILDAGCGTGLSGIALTEQGFTNIHGKDLSPEMLTQAKKTGVYNSLSEVNLTNPILVEEPYDAIFSCGVFGFGPPYPQHLHYLIDILNPGGHAVITVNGKGWVETKWPEELEKAVKQDALKLEETLDIEYLENEDIKGKLLIFRA
jgi:predicted TPR repeat methyltransferase